jgi:hypothetical protein
MRFTHRAIASASSAVSEIVVIVAPRQSWAPGGVCGQYNCGLLGEKIPAYTRSRWKL